MLMAGDRCDRVRSRVILSGEGTTPLSCCGAGGGSRPLGPGGLRRCRQSLRRSGTWRGRRCRWQRARRLLTAAERSRAGLPASAVVITPGWVTRPIALREAIVAEFGLGMRVAMAPAAAVQAQAW